MQDFFRGRVLFPIFDAQGDRWRSADASCPAADGAEVPNTPETPLYAKSKVALRAELGEGRTSVQAGEVIVCEGYTDVIGFARAGMPRAVATCGTALTEDHVRLLKRFAPRVVLAFDPDAAGQAAAERFYAVGAPATRSTWRWPTFPAGMDPADLAGSDPERLRAAIDGATPFLGFRIDRVARRGRRCRSPEGRARAAEAALAAIAEHPSELVRDQYLMEVADRCRIDPDRLRASLRSGRIRVAVPSAPARIRRGRDTPESRGAPIGHPPAGRHAPAAQRGAVRRRHPPGGVPCASRMPTAASTMRSSRPIPVRPSCCSGWRWRRPTPIQATCAGCSCGTRPCGAARELETASRAGDDFASYSAAHSWLKLQIERVQPDAPSDRVAEDELLAWLGDRVEESR